MRRFNAITTFARIADRQDRINVAVNSVAGGVYGDHPSLRLYGRATALQAKLRRKLSLSRSCSPHPGQGRMSRETMPCRWRPTPRCLAIAG